MGTLENSHLIVNLNLNMSTTSNLTTTDAPWWDSPDNHAPVVSVITWFLIITSLLAVLARIATRFAVIRGLRLDDVVILLALVRFLLLFLSKC